MISEIAGIQVGHHTDRSAWTGCTVVVVPDGATCSAEVRGLGPATRELDLLVPGANVQAPQAIVLTGGSAFGLAACDGVVRALEEDGRGHATPTGPVPIVSAAVIYDLPLGRADVRPGPEQGEAAYRAAAPGAHEVGCVGAGTGATAGKLDGHHGWTKGGLGAASALLGDSTTVAALAVANPFGDVLDEHGRVIAGLRRGGVFRRTSEALLHDPGALLPGVRQATTLVCVATDAALSKSECRLLARAAHAGLARAVDPAATAVDGDVAFAVATGAREAASVAALCVVGATVVAAAIRDAVRSATRAPGCPAARDLARRAK